ncbi:ADP-ribosyl-[dinitrogen reductase] glycohydrolase [Shimia thalassica]|uniref:ADP-ribosyl-[dinitrogen reductase] glycohydrolase n=1 Tax=Shimia thalassica TaxID=1715693 RepID=A0A0P1I9A5_9RHOB|nr:inositol monophosphatase family protein [Shimia thalassica]CUJ83584.1 ADP-ribosyl-[dinitrogen reductase] glycohydrolase [Shimia thalassica]
MTESTNQDLSGLLLTTAEVVKTAGAMIRAEFHRPAGPRGTLHKAVIDNEVEAFLKAQLVSLHPASWLGEETERTEVHGPDTWVVDPHDGTADFMKGLRGSAISVALLRNDEPVLGVVFAPTAPDDKGDLICWARGEDLTRNGLTIKPTMDRKQLIVGLNADAADYAFANHVNLGGARVRALPSPAYRLALASVGEIDAAISLVNGLAPWDIAGGHALLIGAGKTLTQRNGRVVDYKSETFNGVIAGAPDIVERLKSAKIEPHPKSRRTPASPKVRIQMADTLARAQGTLLGQLAGDALGSFVEFQDAATIAHQHPEGVVELSDGGTWNLIAGQPTDDGEMALALARSLCAQECFDTEHVKQSYIDWRRSRPFDIGMTTSRAISALETGSDVSFDSQANGALMRASPIGVFAHGNPELASEIARKDAHLTHPNRVTVAANSAFAAAISIGTAGANEEEMWSAAYAYSGENSGGDVVRKRLIDARTKRPAEYQHQMGWVLTAFQNAFYCLMAGKSLRDAVVSTVAQGGDTDTNAAICGALVGARQGRDAVPLQWRNAVLTCRPIEGKGIRHPRPKAFWPDDTLELAEALLAANR